LVDQLEQKLVRDLFDDQVELKLRETHGSPEARLVPREPLRELLKLRARRE
jgi:hypothetical protein